MKIRVKNEEAHELSTLCRQLKLQAPVQIALHPGQASLETCHQVVYDY
jgi:hypothetical protein